VRGNLTPNPFPWGKGNNRVGGGIVASEPNPLSPFPVKEGGTEKIWGDDRSWMRRLGTGIRFAARSCPRSFHSSELRSLGQDDGKRLDAEIGITDFVNGISAQCGWNRNVARAS
jgi:hypothetical protein